MQGVKAMWGMWCRSLRPVWTWGAGAALSLLLVACGGGGGGAGSGGGGVDSPDLSGRRYLPLQVGYRWIYQDSTLSQPVTVRLAGTRSVGGGTGYVLQSDDPEDEESVLLEDAQGLRQFPGEGASALSAAVGPMQLLRYPLRVGDSHVVVDKQLGPLSDVDGDGRLDSIGVRADAVVVGLEAQDTPVGRVAECLHVRTTLVLQVRLSSTGQTVSVTSVNNDWFAPGVGRVRSEIVDSGDGVAPTTTVQRLTGYGLGALRSETVAPTAAAAALTPGVVLGRDAVLGFSFSEDMDATTLAGALQVTDASGSVVAGTVSTTARGLEFRRAAGWATGSYTARLSTAAQDAVGNPLAAALSWNFGIDASAPTLVSSNPAHGTVDVPLASSIVLRFSEPVAPASVNANTVLATYEAITLRASYAVSGAEVTLTPLAPLVRGKPYTIRIDGVTDLLGNALSGVEVSFRSDPGRFGAYIALAPAAGAATASVDVPVAAGDLNGDGRKDIVATSVAFVDGVWRSALVVYRQNADGTLAAGQAIPMPEFCSPAALAIGDVTGDGLNDLVVAQYDCGVRILRQTAGGALVEHAHIDNPASARMQLADINGDGRLDLVLFGGTDNVIRIWANQASGFVLQDAISIDDRFGGLRRPDLVVGDLNGDGRPDIVVSADGMPAFAGAALLLQTPGGSYAAPQWLYTGDNGRLGSLAIGDIDGDGRPDLVAGPDQGLMVFAQRSDGQLAPGRRVDNEIFPTSVTLADLNGDGRLDIVAGAIWDYLQVRLQEAGGTLAPQALYPDAFRGAGLSPGSIAVADVNGDGLPDVLLGGHLFLQRPVPVMSQSVRPTSPAAKRSLDRLLRSAVEGLRAR